MESAENNLVKKENPNSTDNWTALPMKEDKRGIIAKNILKKEDQYKPQGELALDGQPKGRFSGGTPNIVDGEDLDLPPEL